MNCQIYVAVLFISLGGILQVNADDPTDCPYPSDEITYLPDPTNCSQYFQCFRGEKTTIVCQNGLVWNKEEEVCDYIENTDCDSTTTAATTAASFLRLRLGERDEDCPYPSDVITYITDATNCSQYFQCFRGEKTTLRCSKDKYWNEEEQVCDYKENTPCDLDPPGLRLKSVGLLHLDGSDPINVGEKDPMCLPASETITYFQDPTNCSQYFECHRGNKTVLACWDNLLWNDVEKVCDYPENTECFVTASPTPDPGPTSDPGPTPAPEPTTPGADIPASVDPSCPVSETIIYSIVPGKCKMFYECYRGWKFTMTCPGDMYWNHIYNFCDNLEHVDCSRRTHVKAKQDQFRPTEPTKPEK
ncbi:hypothetical protein JTB14_029632 [Gonioctena quinquepunctata]|nr:hypothetical protein JTB14_029632 [Gonioctena quinquepunctata]